MNTTCHIKFKCVSNLATKTISNLILYIKDGWAGSTVHYNFLIFCLVGHTFIKSVDYSFILMLVSLIKFYEALLCKTGEFLNCKLVVKGRIFLIFDRYLPSIQKK